MQTLLKNDFYKIKSLEVAEDRSTLKSVIELNRSHDIFKGHFPEIPVVPGVCTVQMIKEIIMEVFNKDMMLISGQNIKLHNPINPDFHLSLNVDINLHQETDVIHANAEVYFEKLKFCSFRGAFKVI